MRTVQTTKHRYEIYDSIEDMPIVRYHKFNQLLVMGNGVGNDGNAILSHIGAARQLIRDGKTKEADLELANVYHTVSFMTNLTDPKNMAFAALVKSIDGKECDDITQAGLEAISAIIQDDMKVGERDDALDGIKKK